ncbi:Bacteriophage HK97-gp10, putative tail-component [Caloranaerobacter azorensis DSM 13643]|uniref:Bacteriophage HK97-gp10, putative tail-component n=1 Tax=Caloranaerobacter azorensis DSM 13643 TaxID=1121264 RepID=A0A1M5TW05_9FIRM|nr:HK97 gp10 family phage protein [Caloranaerobacter azorensis]SHH54977.1 Bacteriophage HK97-gp10, putative tail-component [Caloranaerobacter azorensis DSM 13643]
MSSSNYRRNKAFIDKYRKELKAMLDDISDIDKKILNKAVNTGAAYARRNTPVGEYKGNVVEFTTRDGKHVRFTISTPRVGGFLRKSWHVMPTKKTPKGVEKELVNSADYASYVNYGHRIVQGGVTKGWVKGQFILEKAMHRVDKALVKEFKKEIERVNKKYDK